MYVELHLRNEITERCSATLTKNFDKPITLAFPLIKITQKVKRQGEKGAK
jgi:hypothetical protein